MKIPASRHQGESLRRLPQDLENKEDGAFMTFPKGENCIKKMNDTDLNPAIDLISKLKTLYIFFNTGIFNKRIG